MGAKRAILGCLALVLIPHLPSAYGQCETGKVSPSDGLLGDSFGTATDINGNWFIVGAPAKNDGIGTVYLFERAGLAWTERTILQPEFLPSAFDFGRSVSLDGPFAAVGSPKASGSGQIQNGLVAMYRLTGALWMYESLSVPFDATTSSEFGAAVSVYADAVLIGAPFTDGVNTPTGSGNSGSAYVYRRNNIGGNWVEEAALTASDASELDAFGTMVKLHANWAFVGSPADKDPNFSASLSVGSVYVFHKQGSTTWLQVQKLVASDAQLQTANRRFGTALDTDGNVLIVGERQGQSAYVFRRVGATWAEEAILKKPVAHAAGNDQFATAVAIEGDLALVGAPADDDNGLTNSGTVFAYRRIGGTWTEQPLIYATDAIASNRLGTSLAVDGADAVAGALQSSMGVGAGYAYSTSISSDCNENAIEDDCEFWLDASLDLNGNGTFDACECSVDLDCDDSNECTAETCDPPIRLCVHESIAYGTTCGPAPLDCETERYCDGRGACIAGPPPGEWQSINPYPGVLGTVLSSTGWDPDGPGPHPELLVVGGSFTIPGVPGTNNIAAWDRTRWMPLGQGFNAAVYSLAVGKDRYGAVLYAGGSFTASGATPLQRVAKWNRLSWSAVGDGFTDSVYVLYAGEDQSEPFVYAGGKFTLGNPQFAAVAKWDGVQWTAMGQGMSSCPTSLCGANIQSLILYDAGTGHDLYASGFFNYADGVNTNRIARWRNGHWEPVGTGFFASGAPLVVFDDGGGKKLCTSAFSTSSYTDVGRWNGQAWSLLPRVYFASIATLCADNDPAAPALYVGGPNRTLRKWDGTTWSYLNTPTFNQWKATSLTVMGEGSGKRLFMAGDFYYMGEPWVRAYGIAAWNGQNWRALTSGVGLWAGPSMAKVSGPQGDELYFSAATERTEQLEAAGVVRWDGHHWSSTGASKDPFSNQLKNISTGPYAGLYALNVFSDDFPSDAVHIEKFDGSQWFAVEGDLVGDPGVVHGASVLDAVVYDDGTGTAFYACGRFSTAGGVTTRNVARWDGQSWSGLGGGIGVELFDQCYAMEVFDDGSGPQLYVGGYFHVTAGSGLIYLARWDGAMWHGLGDPALCDAVHLKAIDDGSGPKLFVGGYDYFGASDTCEPLVAWDGTNWSIPGGGLSALGVDSFSILDVGHGERLFMSATIVSNSSVTITRLYMWDGQTWLQGGPDGNGTIGALESFDDGSGPAIIARGGFIQLGNVTSFGLARWGCPFPMGDIHRDRAVDLLDFQGLHPCLSGPLSVYPGTCASESDIEADFDVDLADFAAFQRAFGQ